jgi:hypothetical protein
VRLGIPLYGCDPALMDLGGKSGSRHAFRECGHRAAGRQRRPAGFARDLVAALTGAEGTPPPRSSAQS